MFSRTLKASLMLLALALSTGCHEGSQSEPSATYPSEPAVIEFFVAPEIEPPDPTLRVDDLRREFHRDGPDIAGRPSMRWLPLKDIEHWDSDVPPGIHEKRFTDPPTYFKVTHGLIVEVHDNRPYMLVFAAEGMCMTHDGADQWAIVSAARTVDHLNGLAIRFRFDEAGARLFGPVARESEDWRLATVVDGQVIAAGHMSRWRVPDSSTLVAAFPEQEIDALLRRVR
ncbi:MAG: hypothetical protein JSV91_12480 [Phycisphaerales bacterium]|nr:MAG: hypothetical protein JSV91_12480 [Phycisphaerales bacterium]